MRLIKIRKGEETQIVDRSTYDSDHRQEGWSIVESVTAAPPAPQDEEAPGDDADDD